MNNNCIFLIPVYNEEGSIRNVIENIIKLKNSGINIIKIVVIDDGSTDRTPEILNELQKRYDVIKVLTHPSNAGIEEVFRNGLNEAIKYADDEGIIILLEGDNTNDPDAIPEMVKNIREGSDLVVASRFARKGLFKGFPLHRKIISFIGNKLLKWTFRIDNITDYTIFLRAYRTEILKKAIEKYGDNLFETTGFVVNTELLIKAASFSKKISEVPHFYNYTRKSNFSKFKVLKTAKDQLIYILKHLLSKHTS